MMRASMTDLQEAIQNLEAMAKCIEGVVKLLQRVQARPWPDLPGGEGIAGEQSAGLLQEEICSCGHGWRSHHVTYGFCLSCTTCARFVAKRHEGPVY